MGECVKLAHREFFESFCGLFQQVQLNMLTRSLNEQYTR